MNWNDIDHSFCEANIRGKLPEYYNSITGLFLILFGLHGLCSVNDNYFVELLYGMLSIVGIGTVGYHYYGTYGWALLDETPMLLTTYMGVFYTEHVRRKMDNLKQQSQIQKWVLLGETLFMSLFLVLNSLDKYRLYFPAEFSFVVIYLYCKIYKVIQLLSEERKKQIMNKIVATTATVVGSAGFWIVTENVCNRYHHDLLLLGHPLWHFFVGHGFYNLIQIMYFIECVQKCDNVNLQYGILYLIKIKKCQ
jgi:Ceramidase